jgi:hypothetical protein
MLQEKRGQIFTLEAHEAVSLKGAKFISFRRTSRSAETLFAMADLFQEVVSKSSVSMRENEERRG